MIRESGFPIAQFERALTEAKAYVNQTEQDLGDDVDVMGKYLFDYVKYYFQNDLHGGSPMISLGEQFLGYQATPHGKGATALHAFLTELAGNLVLEGVGLFSIYFIRDGNVMLQAASDPNQSASKKFIAGIRAGQINRSRVWEPALRTALADLNFESEPKIAGDVILLKSHALSWTVRELVPQPKISAFLGKLISEHRGRTYSPEDLFKLARDSGIDFEMLVGDWLQSTSLPGFLARKPTVELVSIDEDYRFEYQTSVVVRNDEPVPGAVGIEYQFVGSRDEFWADTVHFPGNTTFRIALRTTSPLERITLHPHLALNRNDYTHWLAEPMASIPQGTALPYIQEYDWRPVEDDTSIIVDDLSEGFSIANGRDYHPPPKKRSMFAYWLWREPDLFDPNLNHGLPSLRDAKYFAMRAEFSLWYRESERTSHGKYYRTYTSNPMGTKEAQPQFAATLPSAGRWHLEYHVPSTKRWNFYAIPRKSPYGGYQSGYFPGRRDLGKHKFEINTGDSTELTELDLSGARSGWHELGIFEASSREVRVTLVEVTDGVAIADAIKWTPVD